MATIRETRVHVATIRETRVHVVTIGRQELLGRQEYMWLWEQKYLGNKRPGLV